MRRNRLGGLELECQFERPGRELRSPRRRALYSTYYHRINGRVRPGDRLPVNFQPESLDATTRLLGTTLAVSPAPKHVSDFGRRCVSQMLIYGYRPSAECSAQFDDLVMRVAQQHSQPVASGARNAKEYLRRWGEREFAIAAAPSAKEAREIRRLRDVLAQAGSQRLVSLPTTLVHAGDAFQVEKDVYLRTALDDVSWLVNPENWEQMGDFFARTYRDGDNPNDDSLVKARPWAGVLREDFIVTWNGFTTSVFQQRLKVDYTVSANAARTDYALMYEEDDQVVTNEGFIEVARDENLPRGWIRGRMTKKIKFTSSVLNLLCPALLSMMLDSQVGGFNNFLPNGARRPVRP